MSFVFLLLFFFSPVDFPWFITLCPLLFCPSVKAQLWQNSSSGRPSLLPAAINVLPPPHLLFKMEFSCWAHHILCDWYTCAFYFTYNSLLRLKGTSSVLYSPQSLIHGLAHRRCLIKVCWKWCMHGWMKWQQACWWYTVLVCPAGRGTSWNVNYFYLLGSYFWGKSYVVWLRRWDGIPELKKEWRRSRKRWALLLAPLKRRSPWTSLQNSLGLSLLAFKVGVGGAGCKGVCWVQCMISWVSM